MEASSLIFNEDFIKRALLTCDSPQRVSIKDDFFTSSAVLFSIIPYEDRPYKLVLIHRSDKGIRHKGEMSFPGGKFDSDLDRSLQDTALRETEEEVGVPRGKIKIIGCLDDFPTMTKYIITPFIGIIDKNQKLVKDDREVQEIVKIPINFFTSRKNFKEQAVDINGNKFPIFYFNYIKKENGKIFTVWGATAYMISNFLEKVYDFNLSELNLKRFKLDKIKHIKEYIKYRDQIKSKF